MACLRLDETLRVEVNRHSIYNKTQISPPTYNETWTVTNIVFYAEPEDAEQPDISIYRGFVHPSRLVIRSMNYDQLNRTTANMRLVLMSGEELIMTVNKGKIGTTVFAHIRGERHVAYVGYS